MQAKQGFITLILEKDKYFLARCWLCAEEYIIDDEYNVRKLIP
jgi:hypothetical protein